MHCFNHQSLWHFINEQKQVLVSDELIRGMYITKFPGGGLEFGEGTRDCLAREFMEEMNLQVEVGEHIYTPIIFRCLLSIPNTRSFLFIILQKHWKK